MPTFQPDALVIFRAKGKLGVKITLLKTACTVRTSSIIFAPSFTLALKMHLVETSAKVVSFN